MHHAMSAARFLAVLSVAVLASAGQAAEPPLFQSTLKIDLKKSFKNATAADSRGPEWGYVSANAGGFTLDDKKGRAGFRWNHGLDADWHEHEMAYVGTAVDDVGNAYWVYSVEVNHGNHVDEIWIYFAQSVASGQLDEGYRIFFGHFDYEKGMRPQEPGEHDIHLWCTDATRLKYHKP